jgi:hypothetical protein
MERDLYELLWNVETDLHSFLYREYKVFGSNSEARRYAKNREVELNEGETIEERAQDGYCYKHLSACKIKEIDGFLVKLVYK